MKNIHNGNNGHNCEVVNWSSCSTSQTFLISIACLSCLSPRVYIGSTYLIIMCSGSCWFRLCYFASMLIHSHDNRLRQLDISKLEVPLWTCVSFARLIQICHALHYFTLPAILAVTFCYFMLLVLCPAAIAAYKPDIFQFTHSFL